VAAAILSPALARWLAPALVAPLLLGAAVALSGLRRQAALDSAPPPASRESGPPPASRNPLQLRSALEMALVFQVVLVIVALMGSRFGAEGVLGIAAVVGLTDADALTLSMAREAGQGSLPVAVAARAVAVGLLSNTIVKIGIATVAGRDAFRATTTAVLLLMAVALALAAALTPVG
jgi:uncharacterized membrane protein (DUF4010 family)